MSRNLLKFSQINNGKTEMQAQIHLPIPKLLYQLIILYNICTLNQAKSLGPIWKRILRPWKCTRDRKRPPEASRLRSFSDICTELSCKPFLSGSSGTFHNYALPLSSYLPLITCPSGPSQMGINPALNTVSLSEDFTVIIAWEKDVAFLPPPPNALFAHQKLWGMCPTDTFPFKQQIQH